MTTVADGLFQYGGVPVGTSGLPFPPTGKAFFVDPANGSDGNSGRSPSQAFATIYKGHAACTTGKNDVVFLVGDGGTTATARLSLANAVAVDSAATTGTLTWSKSATHLIGITAPSTNRRARLATPTGTYTQATFNALPLITVSGSGCYMSNFSVFSQFSTGANGEIALNVTGSRNSFNDVDLLGPASTVAIQGTSTRTVKITGAENTFTGGQIGVDTVTRTVANSLLEFASATARNTFNGVNFVFQGSSAAILGIIGTGSGCMDRWQLFRNCTFINNVQSTSTTMDALATLPASAGGLLLFKECTLVGITEFGTDATSRGQIYVDGGTVTAGTSGIAVNPT
jgi:hypothetical protein